MRQVAKQTVHPEVEDPRNVPQLVAAFNRGDRLGLKCGKVAYLAIAVLRRAGFEARMVGVLTREKYDFSGDGHTLLEAKQGGRWVVYDPNSNRQPLGPDGKGIGIQKLVQMRPFRWRWLAHDVYYEPDPNWGYAKVDKAYDRAFQVPFIESKKVRVPGDVGPVMAYHDPEQRPRIEPLYSGAYRYVDAKTWQNVVN